MKIANQLARKLSILSQVIILSFTLSIFSTGKLDAQEFSESITSIEPKHDIYSLAVNRGNKINKYEKELKSYDHVAINHALKMEYLMKDLERWRNIEYIEKEMVLENWMMEPLEWQKKDFTDEEFELEDWMCCPEQFINIPKSK